MAGILYFEIIGYLVLLPSICLFGIVGNILTLIVLTRGGIQAIAYNYFTALAILDLLSLVFVFPIALVRCPVCSFDKSEVGQVFEIFLYISVGDVFVKASIWTTVLFTVERTLATCLAKPFIRTERRTVIIAVSLVVAICTLENIPSFFIYSISPQREVVRTQVSTDSAFFAFYRWFDFVFLGAFPFSVLLIFNVILIRTLLRRRHRVATCRFQLSARSGRIIEESRVLFTLIGVILLFLLTIFPSLVIQATGGTVEMSSDTFAVIRITIAILVSVNASGNFILYCLLNRRFFRAFKRLFCSTSTSEPAAVTVTSRCEESGGSLTYRLSSQSACYQHLSKSDSSNIHPQHSPSTNVIGRGNGVGCDRSSSTDTLTSSASEPEDIMRLIPWIVPLSTRMIWPLEEEQELPPDTVSLTSPCLAIPSDAASNVQLITHPLTKSLTLNAKVQGRL